MGNRLKVVKSIPSENKFFQSEYVEVGNGSQKIGQGVVNIIPEVKYQQILGFGGSFTESSAYNYSLMDEETKKRFITAYFDKEEGIAYNFGRTCISSCDFALDIYSYIEAGDKTLKTFNIDRDKKYIIPLLKDALAYTCGDIVLFASPWTPPAFMKDNNSYIEGGSLLEEYKAVWALYYVKYIKAYLEEGIKISAISVQNEPNVKQPWESCFYTAEEERDFVRDYLAPTLKEQGLQDIKIIVWDHNKERLFERAQTILSDSKVNDDVWAVGHHWYTGEHFESVKLVNEVFKKPTICTEFCCECKWDAAEESAELYGKEMIGDLNSGDIAICDWNLLLDEEGGPYHNRTKRVKNEAGIINYEVTDRGCLAPIMLNSKSREITLTPIYYYMGHITKFVKKGARVIVTTKYTSRLETVAFENPDKSIVLVVLNTSDEDLPLNIRLSGVCTNITVPAHSMTTAIYE